MFNIEIICFGKLEFNLHKISEKYQKMISPYARLKITDLKALSFSKNNKIKTKNLEEGQLLSYLNKYNQNQVFLLSEDGKLYNSLELASFLEKKENELLVLVIGGALGFSKNLKTKYKLISLSPLTLAHQLCRVVLLEQIYRSITIINKKSYHY